MGRRTIRLYLADDRPVIAAGVKHILEECADLEFVGQSGSSRDAAREIAASSPAVVVLGGFRDLPDIVDAAIYILTQFPSLNVLTLLPTPDVKLMLRLLRVGVRGGVVKSTPRQEWKRLVRALAVKKRALCMELMDTLLRLWSSETETADSESVPARLSAREYEVLTLLADGKSNQEIGRKLGVSPKTVATYKTRIMGKVKVKTARQLTSYAIRLEIARRGH